jgi:streptomycin 6-kinase
VADAGLTHTAWLERVPDLLAAHGEEWGLRLGEPYAAGAAGFVVRAELADGTPAVLKLIYPHREAEHEADALAAWDGDGAVRLIARDADGWAMLIERCVPGTRMADALGGDAALDAIIELLPRLWRPAAEPFRPLADEAAWWIERLPVDWIRFGRPFERRLVDAAVDALASLHSTQGEQVLVHQDLHGKNVLAAQRQPWLVIDPKPLVGEREFGLAPIIRSCELGEGRRGVLRRLDRLTSQLGLDRERARGWALGQTVAWAVASSHVARHAETAHWLLEAS